LWTCFREFPWFELSAVSALFVNRLARFIVAYFRGRVTVSGGPVALRARADGVGGHVVAEFKKPF
jgi:hypothetical protein